MNEEPESLAVKNILAVAEHLTTASKLLSAIVVDHCDGYGDFTYNAQEKLVGLLTRLIRLRNDVDEQATHFREDDV